MIDKQKLNIFWWAHGEVFQWALYRVGYDQELAEEITPQTYLKVLSRVAKSGRESKLKTWLFGIVRLPSDRGCPTAQPD